MFEKRVLHSLFSRVQGSFEVQYWDKGSVTYGPAPSRFRVVIRHPSVVRRALRNPRIAVARAYEEGDVDVEGDLREVIELGIRNVAALDPLISKIPLRRVLLLFSRAQSLRRSRANVQQHYDLGNDFFSLWLDPGMNYSCAYFRAPEDTLAQAQLNKIDLVLSKLQLRPGQRLLDIGCGWGSLILRAAQEHGVEAVGITLAEEQYGLARQRIQQLGLQDRVTVELKDYRELGRLDRRFDAIASVGMMEHVGHDNIPAFMHVVRQSLNPAGLALLHFLSRRKEYNRPSWGNTTIFPGGYIPSLRGVLDQAGDLDLRTLDVQNLRAHYPITLDRWYENFEKHTDAVREMYGDRFIRTWRLYLRGSAALLAWGVLEVHQVLLSAGHRPDFPMTRETLR